MPASEILIGQTFGNAEILEILPHNPGEHRRARCKCTCGSIFVTALTSLKTGGTKSCGCLKAQAARTAHTRMKRTPMVGKRFGRLVVTTELPPLRFGDGKPARNFACQCDCGKTAEVMGASLRSGKSRSCGCLRDETARKHGKVRTKVYYAWQAMFQRCENPNHINYKDYGARGIKVCEAWRDFETFYRDIGDPPPSSHRVSLGRKNNDGDYEPKNVRWESDYQQAQNTRANRVFTVNGVTGCMWELARHFGLPPYIPGLRLRKGWTVEKAFTEPVRPKRSNRQDRA